MMMFLNSLITFMSVLASEREREKFSSSRWQQLLIKSGPMKQDSRQSLSLSLDYAVSFFLLLFPLLHLYFGFPSLEQTDPRCERGEKKIHLHILDSPVDQYKSFFFRGGNYRERH